MVSITLSVPEETRNKMKKFPEVNWSRLVRKTIEDKTKELSWKEEMLKQLEKDKEFEEWAVDIGRKVKTNRAKQLKELGLI